MKNKIFILLSVCLCAAITTYAQVYDFKSENKDGIELAYKILDDGESVALTYNTHPNTSTPFSVLWGQKPNVSRERTVSGWCKRL